LRADSVSCFKVPNPVSGNVFVEDENGMKVDSLASGGSISIAGGSQFYYVFWNGDVQKNSSLHGCGSVDYSFSVPGKLKVFSYSNLQIMNSSYYSDYASLKKDLKSDRDFAIIIFDGSRNRIFEMTGNIPRVQIISTEYPMELLKDNELIKGAIRIQTW